MAPDPAKKSLEVLSWLSDYGDSYSDLTIIAEHEELKVHKAVICPQSSFFEAACRATLFEEARTGRIDLSADQPDLVKLMVHYFYHLDYDCPSQSKIRPVIKDEEGNDFCAGPFHVNMRMYGMGDKYGIAGLKEAALTKFTDVLSCGPWISCTNDNFVTTVRDYLENVAGEDENCPLKEAIIRAALEHEDLFDREDFQDVLRNSDLAFELLMRRMQSEREDRSVANTTAAEFDSEPHGGYFGFRPRIRPARLTLGPTSMFSDGQSNVRTSSRDPENSSLFY